MKSPESQGPTFSDIAADHFYETQGGTKLRLVHPIDKVKDFNFQEATGALDVWLAPFGRFQTGVSIQGPVAIPEKDITGCTRG